MMIDLTLPCGCRITEATVLAMCIEHVWELRRKADDWNAAYAKYDALRQQLAAERTDGTTGSR